MCLDIKIDVRNLTIPKELDAIPATLILIQIIYI